MFVKKKEIGMKHLVKFELFEKVSSDMKPDNLKDLKKLMRQVSNDRNGKLGWLMYGEFSVNTANHRGNFMFIQNPDKWDLDGLMSYTGSGSPKIYIDNVNQKFFNGLGWEMVDLGARTVQVRKLN